ncbi:MAG: hypothetical protein HFF44_07790 [Lawsonibacter sp.]|nr:hypothetical protein [Lawsonibacter sp.]
MGYCEKHLKREKGGAVSEIVMCVCAVPFALIGLIFLGMLIYMSIFEWASFGIGGVILSLLFGAAFLAIGIGFVWGARIHRKKRLAIGADVENSNLIQSIRAQVPAEQTALPVPELFALVDQDLAGGQSFGGNVDLGRTWVLVGDQAILLRRLRGAFLIKKVHTTSKVVSTSYDVNLYDATRLIAFPTFARKSEAKRLCEALAAAMPQIQTGRDKEEKAFLKTLEEAVNQQ